MAVRQEATPTRALCGSGPRGHSPRARPERDSPCWPSASPAACTERCLPDREPATHQLPRCPRAPAAAAAVAADRHLRREDSTEAGSSLYAAWREGQGWRGARTHRGRELGPRVQPWWSRGLLGPGRERECEGGCGRAEAPATPPHRPRPSPRGDPAPLGNPGGGRCPRASALSIWRRRSGCRLSQTQNRCAPRDRSGGCKMKTD